VRIVLARSLPLIGFIVLGFLLKQIGLIRRSDRRPIARVIFATTLPAAVFTSLSSADVELRTLLPLALCGALIPLVTHLAVIQMTKTMGLSRELSAGVVLSTLVSSVLLYLAPFFLALYGSEGFNRVVAFDVGNALVASSYAYYVATRYVEGGASDWHTSIKRIFTVPQFWACLLAIAVKITGASVPTPALGILEPLAAANVPLGMLLLGTFIELRFRVWKPMLVAIGLRVGLGWAVGQAMILLMGLTGLERLVVSLAPVTPIGIVSLIYASLLGLDTELPAATLSLSILVSIVLTPLFLWVYALV